MKICSICGKTEHEHHEPVWQESPKTIQSIVELSSQEFGVSIKALIGETRSEPVVTARMAAMQLTWKHCGLSNRTIARFFGKRDHGTVIYARKRVSDLLETNKAFSNAYRNIEAKINL